MTLDPQPPWECVRALWLGGAAITAVPDGFSCQTTPAGSKIGARTVKTTSHAIFRFVEEWTDLGEELDRLLKFLAPLIAAGHRPPTEMQVWARVTDTNPGFGLHVSLEALRAISSWGTEIDISVYTASDPPAIPDDAE